MRVAATNAVAAIERSRADRLELDNVTFKERVVPGLRRELDLERAENLMLKEKLNLWRMEMQKDKMLLAQRIAEGA
jgi:hypothetical protein